MRVHVMSDLHFEHMRKEFGDEFFKKLENVLKQDPADLLILAGDICQIGRHEAFWKARMATLCGYYKKVIYVPGNHEYYCTGFLSAGRFLESIDGDPSFSNLVQLDGGTYIYGGYRFIGDTMWFPEIVTDRSAKRMMSDFSVIGEPAAPFEPLVYQKHSEFLNNVMSRLKTGDIVVTHHTPLPASINSQYVGSPINPFFMADMTPYLHEGTLPSMWIHGHTHSPFDYRHKVGSEYMRVYCNSHGYPGEGENPHFWDRIAIDIPDTRVYL